MIKYVCLGLRCLCLEFICVSHWRHRTFARGSQYTRRDRIFTCVSCWSVVTFNIKVLAQSRQWAVTATSKILVGPKLSTSVICALMEGRSVTLFANAVLCNYNYWNPGSQLVYIVIDCHWCVYMSYAFCVIVILIVKEFWLKFTAESLKTSFIFLYIFIFLPPFPGSELLFTITCLVA